MDYSKLSDEELEKLAAQEEQSAALSATAAPNYDAMTDEQLEAAAREEELASETLLGKAGRYTSNVLDYTGGVGRSAVLANPMLQMINRYRTGKGDGMLEKLATGKDLVTMEDMKAALNPLDGKNAPSTAEYLEKGGVGEMGRVSDLIPMAEPGTGGMFTPEKGGKLDITGRGAAGFVGDVALDPATWASFGASAALKTAGKAGAKAIAAREAVETAIAQGVKGEALQRLEMEAAEAVAKVASSKAGAETAKKLETVLNPIGGLMESGGKKLYKSAFGEADRVAAAKGKDLMPSEIMWDDGFKGTMDSAAARGQTMADDALRGRDEIFARADQAGASVDPNDALANLRAYVADKAKNASKSDEDLARAFLRKAEKDYDKFMPQDQVTELRTLLGDAPEVSRIPGQAPHAPPQGPFMPMDIPGGAAPDNRFLPSEQLPLGGEVPAPMRQVNLAPEVPVPQARNFQPTMGELPPAQAQLPLGYMEPSGPPTWLQLGDATPAGMGKSALPDVPAEQLSLVGDQVISPARRGATTAQASSLKSGVYNALPGSKWAALGQTTQGQDMLKTLGRGWKEATEEGVGKTLGQGSKQAVQEANERAGALLTVAKTMQKEGGKEARKMNISQIDMALAAMGSPLAFKALAGKQGAKFLNSTAGKTYMGKGLYNAGKAAPIWQRLGTGQGE